jgi:uncharacterized protein (TIGR00299 family) protein
VTLAYFDCASGISGDMFLGAMVDAGLEFEKLSAAVESLGIEGLRLEAAKVKRLGFAATKVSVMAPHEHAHRHLSDITLLIDGSGLGDEVKRTAVRIFTRLAEAEAAVHGEPVEKVHFHEVGALDSIADIVGAAAGIDILGIERCIFSPIPTGSGTVKTAHGVLSVPAPATAKLLVGVPLAPSDETGELTTPTGAAIAKEFAADFCAMPPMTISTVGAGAGTREGETVANVLRVLIGRESADATPSEITVIETTLDDMTGEALSYAVDALFAAGALDAFVTAVSMKKGRPGHLLTVLSAQGSKEALLQTLFRETTTFGARVGPSARVVLDRGVREAPSPLGPFRLKTGAWRGRVVQAAPEYEDARRMAAECDMPFRSVYEILSAAGREFLATEAEGSRGRE